MESKSTAIIFLIGLAIIGLFVWSNAEENTIVVTTGALVAAETIYDFGTIAMSAGPVTHAFTVMNETDQAVEIKKVFTSCMCTTATLVLRDRRFGPYGMPGHEVSAKANIKIEPGETIIVETVFDPAAHGPSGVGLVERSVYLETNSQSLPELELSFRAVVTK